MRSLVERHGGTVRVESRGHGCGSTFIVQLPLAGDRITEDAAHDLPKSKPNTAHNVGKLLVVDDNTDAALLLADVLSALGHQVQVAHSGPDALAELGRFQPDAALLDIGLPVMDGYELPGISGAVCQT